MLIFSRGCLPELKDPGDVVPTRNASGYDLSQKDPARHPRSDHIYAADVHVGRPQKFRPRAGVDRALLIGRPAVQVGTN